MINKQLLVGTLLFTATVAAGYFVRRRVEKLRLEMMEAEIAEVVEEEAK